MFFDVSTQIGRSNLIPAIPTSKVATAKTGISFANILNEEAIDLDNKALKGISLDDSTLRTLQFAKQRQDNPEALVKKTSKKDIGGLSTQFESGSAGITAIGYDRTGGTSYGKYQIASKVGTFDKFIDYLKTEAPDIAKKLQDSGGPANTGSKKGKMVEAWQEIAKAEPERFEALQDEFIYKSHYEPTEKKLSQKMDTSSKAVQELIFSTSVQHGSRGATRIFEQAISKVQDKNGNIDDTKLISAVYNIRKTQFGSSTPEVQKSIENRFVAEEKIAQSMAKEAVA